MRLGSKLLFVGIVIFMLGVSQPAVHENTEYKCSPYISYDCEYVTTYETNDGRNLIIGLGSLLFVGGFGGWIGALDAEGRIKRAEEAARTDDD